MQLRPGKYEVWCRILRDASIIGPDYFALVLCSEDWAHELERGLRRKQSFEDIADSTCDIVMQNHPVAANAQPNMVGLLHGVWAHGDALLDWHRAKMGRERVVRAAERAPNEADWQRLFAQIYESRLALRVEEPEGPVAPLARERGGR